MGTLVKILIGGLAVFLIFGGPRRLKKADAPLPADQAAPAAVPAERPITPGIPDRSLSVVDRPTFKGQPDNLITSLEWLEKNGRVMVEMQDARLTYYLRARSDRTHIDSVANCLREAVMQRNIDPVDFQYTYFLDRVMIAGSGLLIWEGKRYVTNYARLRKAGWTSGERNFKNSYRCNNFRYQSKKPFDFIRANINNPEVFEPYEKARYPNGLTASGQEAVNWHTVSVNPYDFPLSVPNQRRRQQLTQRYAAEGKRVPQARSFIVLIANDGRMFLTEAMDTGSGVKRKWIDWRIGNTSAEIKYFFGIGSQVKAICYVFQDPNITFEQVLAASRPVTMK